MASLELTKGTNQRISIGFSSNSSPTFNFDINSSNIPTQAIDKNPNWTIEIYPVGSIYFSLTNTNPSTYFGGTWERFAQGRCLVGVDANSDYAAFTDVLKTGGAKTVTLTTNQIPSHRHAEDVIENVFPSGTTADNGIAYNENQIKINSSYTGGGAAHNNLQPYYTCYMWLRTN